jgi:hypothetical protein
MAITIRNAVDVGQEIGSRIDPLQLRSSRKI